MAAPAHVFTIGRTAEILPRTSNYCGTSHSTWNRKTAASGSTKPTTNRRWRSRTAAWESLQELVSEHKRSMRPRGPERTVTIHCDSETVLRKLQSSEVLRKYAAGGFAYCATWSLSNLTPLPPTAGDQRILWCQLLQATELFVVAHEYAHHICGHGVVESASVDGIASDLSKAQELEADYYGALLSAHVGAEHNLMFAHDGSGALIALLAVDMLRRTRDVLATGQEANSVSNTHPALDHRLLNLKKLRYDPRQADAVRAHQESFSNLMEGLGSMVIPLLQGMHAFGVRPLPISKEESGWLPF